MNDQTMENRKLNYRKCTFNILEKREQFNLSLRKQKLDEFIFKQRGLHLKVTESSLEINQNTLKVDFSKYLPNGIKSIEESGDLLFNMLSSNDFEYQKYAVYSLKNYYQNIKDGAEMEIEQLISKKIIDAVISILMCTNDNSLIFEIYWIFINICYCSDDDDHELFNIFASDDLIETYNRHFRSNLNEIVENIMWFLCNLIGNCCVLRDKLFNTNIYGDVIKILRQDAVQVDLLRLGAWFMANILKRNETIPPEVKVVELVTIFANYLYTMDLEVVSHCLWGLYYVSQFDGAIEGLNMRIIKSGAIVKMMKLNFSKFPSAVMPSIRCLGNLSAGKYDVVDELLDLNLLDFLDAMIHNYKSFKREIIWAVANCAAGSHAQASKVVDSPYFDRVLPYVNEIDYRVKREALWLISNCASTTAFDICTKLVNKGVLHSLCEVICNQTEERILTVALQSLNSILQSGYEIDRMNDQHFNGNPFLIQFESLGGSACLDKLLLHSSEDVGNLAAEILTQFYANESTY